ncbi:MAG: hypothetical protein AAF721_03855 [Myxococcota bacterium]
METPSLGGSPRAPLASDSTGLDEWPTGDGNESGVGAGSNFLGFPDLGGGDGGLSCDVHSQNCPAGTKCTPAFVDGRASWTLTCMPVVDHPDQDGEFCTVVGHGASGLDSCDRGMMCWDVDFETLVGICVPFCLRTQDRLSCEDPDRTCSGGKEFQLCLPDCDPLADVGGLAGETNEGLQTCPAGCACYPQQATFICAPDMSGEAGAPGDTCEFVNTCGPGTVCLPAESANVCDPEAGACCIPVCDLDDPDAICPAFDPSTSCTPWYEEGQAPPGYEDIGVCDRRS